MILLILLSVISISAILNSDVLEQEADITPKSDVKNESIELAEGIISKVDVRNDSIEVADDWDYYETVLIDHDELMRSADNGTLHITLLDEDIDIIIQNSGERRSQIWYKGFVADSPEYNVDISVGEKEVFGSITTHDMGYNIVPTDVVSNGEVVHLVVASDIRDSRLLEENYPIDPLTFEVINEDTVMHDFAVEVYDPYENLIFNESYSVQPGDTIHSPEISEQLGRHLYVCTLDNNETFTLYASVERGAELSSSQKVSFIFIDDPENSMLIGIEQA